MIPGRRLLALTLLPATALVAGACTDNATPQSASTGTAGGSSGTAAGGAARLTVESTATECKVSATTAPSGNVVFSVTNKGDQATEFYLLGEDGVRIVGEVENIGPGLTRDLVVRAEPGRYVTACKPGMAGDGIRGDFVVSGGGSGGGGTGTTVTNATAELERSGVASYKTYVTQQADALLAATTAFADLYVAGKDEQARAAYAPARVPWERIEPVAESFGDLDPKLDLREADLEPGQTWTGWHRIEKDLWPPAGATAATPAERKQLADQLVADTEELVTRIAGLDFTPDQLGNGAKELLDEVATGKVTGEEEAWSHTDLWDFQANVDGARVAYESLRPIVVVKDAQLADTLDARFAALQAQLDAHKTPGGGFVVYTSLTPEQVKQLADSVNALGEPLSTLTSTVVL